MKQTCGYLDNNGSFHKESKAAELSNTNIKIKIIKEKFYYFEKTIEKYLRSNYFFDSNGNLRPDDIYKLVSIAVLQNFNELKELIDSKKDLKKELDILYKDQAKLKYPGYWWLKYKWW
jgi:hypothetical protein